MDPKAERKRKLLAEAARIHEGGAGRSKTLTREQQLAALIDKSLLAADRALSAAMSKGDPAGISAAVAVVERVHGLCGSASGGQEAVDIVIHDETEPVAAHQPDLLVAPSGGPEVDPARSVRLSRVG